MKTDLNRLKVIRHPDAFDSGANPEFVVTSATRNAREMERLMNVVSERARKLEKRIAGLDAFEQRMREARAVPDDDLPLVEPIHPEAPQ